MRLLRAVSMCGTDTPSVVSSPDPGTDEQHEVDSDIETGQLTDESRVTAGP